MTGRALLLLAAVLAPGSVLARPTLGLRLSFAPSFLDAADRVPMSDVMQSQVPLQVDALYRVGPAFAVGGYGSWALGQVGSAGCAGADCSATALRAGLQAVWSPPLVFAGGAPWLGAGAGWEWATTRRDTLGSEVTYRWSGPEGFGQGGVDWRLAERFWLGPYLLLALGSYGEVTLEASGGSASAGIPDRTVHAWLQVGVRGRIDF